MLRLDPFPLRMFGGIFNSVADINIPEINKFTLMSSISSSGLRLIFCRRFEKTFSRFSRLDISKMCGQMLSLTSGSRRAYV